MAARMKIKEMEKALTDGTIVAVGKYTAQRATILGVRQSRKVYSGARWDWSGHTASDGVLVQLANEDGTPNGEPKVVAPNEVVGTWEDYSTTVAAQREQREVRENAIAKSKREANEAAAKIRNAIPDITGYGHVEVIALGGNHIGGRYEPIRGYAVQLSTKAAAAVATLANAAADTLRG